MCAYEHNYVVELVMYRDGLCLMSALRAQMFLVPSHFLVFSGCVFLRFYDLYIIFLLLPVVCV